MLKFRRLKISIFLLCVVVITQSNLSFSSANSSKMLATAQITMPSATTTNDIIKNITLIAKEETKPPLGIPQKSDRDIGFASVFLRLENPQQANVTVKIKNLEIRNASDGELQNFAFTTQEVTLKPLENSEIVFHLTNKTGYIGQDKVKAAIVYQIGEVINSIESEAAIVDR